MTVTVERRSTDEIVRRPVANVMTRDIRRVPPEASVFEVFATMVRAQVHHVPVVRDDGRCVALLDFPAVVRRLPEALVTQGAAPLLLPGMSGPVEVLPAESLADAAAAMDASDVDACCVVDEHGVLLGLVTARDIVRSVGELSRFSVVREG